MLIIIIVPLTFVTEENADMHFRYELQGVADTSLALQGRKQATATKLDIYSPYSP
jgi:hypothetical protein